MFDFPRAIRITSPDNPRVKRVLALRRQGGAGGRRNTGLFIVEGAREVSRAAAAGLRMRELFLCPQLLKDAADGGSGGGGGGDACPASALEACGPWSFSSVTRCHVAPKVMRKMAYRREPEGTLAVVEQPWWTLDDLARRCSAVGPRPPLMLVAVGTRKPGNLGAMTRTADAAGCAAVLAAGTPVDAFNPNAIRASTGAVFTMPVASASEEAAIGWLCEQNLRLVVATPTADACYTRTDLTGSLAIAVGAEDVGLSDAWLAAADARIVIGMQGRSVDSLNAASAAAVLLFEARRQRAAV